MKSDLDSLMAQRNLDAILITGPGQHNPDMVYFTAGKHLTNCEIIKKRGEAPVLFYWPMERDEAAQTGLPNRNLGDYRLKNLIDEANGDRSKANAMLYQKILAELGISAGRLGLYGKMDAGAGYTTFRHLQDLLPDLALVGESGTSLLVKARATKDETEIARMRKMGQITTTVVGRVAEFLSSHPAKKDVLVKKDGQPLTIGEVKSRINLWLAELGADNPEGTIFAIGRDAGVPHSSGNPADLLRLGQTIVFDIFPCEAGGGYYYDFTRTWCLGYAPEPAQQLYDDVRQVYDQIMNELAANQPCGGYQTRTCELFEAQGHPTVKSNPGTTDGYVHSLGHGLGLAVHESPVFNAGAGPDDRLEPGVVVTIEPGLYYPDRGLGCRLEDSVWVRPDGKMEILAEYPLDLVIPVKG